MTCMQCLQEFGTPSGKFSRVEFRDDSCYEITCSNGHETTTVLQEQKFELLFDIGAYAILDGYYREAVSSFTSSLERFYEFAVRVLLERGSNSDDLFKSCWKLVANQSERQLGAFVFLWGANFREPPYLLHTNAVNVRNAVIHKGKIPTKEEALHYGNSILKVLRPKLLSLKERFPEEIQKITLHHLRDSAPSGKLGRPVGTMSIGTMVSLTCDEPSTQSQTLEDYLIELYDRRETSARI